MRARYITWFPVLLCSCVQAGACLWDYDTISSEAKEFPDVVDAIVGWFPRNPPLYYQMRVDRRQKELASNPTNFDAYDDVVVGHDRLEQDKRALQWLAKEKSILPRADKEHRYHYYANLGTVLAHDWARSGARKENLAELREAEKAISKALEINPDAHFGRERVQLQVMTWLDHVREYNLGEPGDSHASLGAFLDQESERTKGGNFDQRMIKGLVGLVVLGNAWESYDVYEALTMLLSKNRKGRIARLAHNRCLELKKKGHGTFASSEDLPDDMLPYSDTEPEQQQWDNEQYLVLRQMADAEQKRRWDFMIPRLEAGRHPDTDPTFWSGFVEKKRPELKDPPFWLTGGFQIWSAIGVALLLVASLIFGVYKLAGAIHRAIIRRKQTNP